MPGIDSPSAEIGSSVYNSSAKSTINQINPQILFSDIDRDHILDNLISAGYDARFEEKPVSFKINIPVISKHTGDVKYIEKEINSKSIPTLYIKGMKNESRLSVILNSNIKEAYYAS